MIPKSFLGSLSLTTIDDEVDVLDREMLRAIGFMCPSLKHATFTSGSLLSNESQLGPEEKLVSPNELQLILNEWPKVYLILKIYMFV